MWIGGLPGKEQDELFRILLRHACDEDYWLQQLRRFFARYQQRYKLLMAQPARRGTVSAEIIDFPPDPTMR